MGAIKHEPDWEIKAPDYFYDLVELAESLLTEYRSKYPQLKLRDNFELPEKKQIEKEFDALPFAEREQIALAKQLFESYWQLAWKKLFYIMPACRDKLLTYNAVERSLKSLLPPPPPPVPLKTDEELIQWKTTKSTLTPSASKKNAAKKTTTTGTRKATSSMK